MRYGPGTRCAPGSALTSLPCAQLCDLRAKLGHDLRLGFGRHGILALNPAERLLDALGELGLRFTGLGADHDAAAVLLARIVDVGVRLDLLAFALGDLGAHFGREQPIAAVLAVAV